MIQINLIPDVKQQYLNARKTRNIAISISILAGLASAGLVIVLGVTLSGQRIYELVADGDIESEYQQLTEVDALSEAVVLQNQLGDISGLNDSKIVSSRLFGFLEAVNPAGNNTIQYSTVILEPEERTMTIEAIAPSYAAVDIFVKTIQNTKLNYVSGDSDAEDPIASEVITAEQSLGEDGDGRQVVRFEMTITYSENLFSNSVSDVRIISPSGSIDVTDSRTGVPDTLFSVAPTTTTEEN